MKKSPSLREKIRQYLFETELSDEAWTAFRQAFDANRRISLQKAFVAAKKAVEELLKDKHLSTNSNHNPEDSVDKIEPDC